MSPGAEKLVRAAARASECSTPNVIDQLICVHPAVAPNGAPVAPRAPRRRGGRRHQGAPGDVQPGGPSGLAAELREDLDVLMELVLNWRIGKTDSVDNLLVMHEALMKKYRWHRFVTLILVIR